MNAKTKIVLIEAFLTIFLFVLAGFISYFVTTKILEKRESNQIKKNSENNIICNEGDMAIPALVIIGGKVFLTVGVPLIATGGLIAIGVIRHRHKHKVAVISGEDYKVSLQNTENKIYLEMKKLADTHEDIRANLTDIYNQTIQILSLERENIEITDILKEEQKKEKKSKFDRVVDSLDFFDWVKSKETKLRESSMATYQDSDVVSSNIKRLKELSAKVKALKELNGKKQKEIQDDIERLEKLHKSVADLEKLHEDKRVKMTRDGFIPTNTEKFKYKSENYVRMYEFIGKMLAESRDENGKVSAALVCSFKDVMIAAKHKDRVHLENNQHIDRERIIADEARNLNGARREVPFISFYEVININDMPLGYDPSAPALLYTPAQAKGALEYLKLEEEVIKDPSKQQALNIKAKRIYDTYRLMHESVGAVVWENQASVNMNLSSASGVTRSRNTAFVNA